MTDLIAMAFQTDRTRVASLILARDLVGALLPVPRRARGAPRRLAQRHVRRLRAHRALPPHAVRGPGAEARPPCPRATARCSTTAACSISRICSRRSKHDNSKVPLITAGGLGGALVTGRTLNYAEKRRRGTKAVQPVSRDHGPDGHRAAGLRRRRYAAGAVLMASRRRSAVAPALLAFATLLGGKCRRPGCVAACRSRRDSSLGRWRAGLGRASATSETVIVTANGERRVSGIHHPSVTPFLPPRAAATGAAVLVVPGGGHRRLAEASIAADGQLSRRGRSRFPPAPPPARRRWPR